MANKNFFIQPKKAAGKYKSTSSYLRAVYRANKDKIEEVYFENVVLSKAINKPKSSWEMFKRQVLQSGEKLSGIGRADAKARLASLSRTQIYGREELAKQNLRDIMRKDKFAYDTIRRQLGWNKKIDWSNLQYHGDPMDKENRYFYFVDEDGNKVAFKLGSDYKNKKKVTLVTLDQNDDVATEYSALDVRGF